MRVSITGSADEAGNSIALEIARLVAARELRVLGPTQAITQGIGTILRAGKLGHPHLTLVVDTAAAGLIAHDPVP